MKHTPYERSQLLRQLRGSHEQMELKRAALRELGVTDIQSFTRVCAEGHVHAFIRHNLIPAVPPQKLVFTFLPFNRN